MGRIRCSVPHGNYEDTVAEHFKHMKHRRTVKTSTVFSVSKCICIHTLCTYTRALTHTRIYIYACVYIYYHVCAIIIITPCMYMYLYSAHTHPCIYQNKQFNTTLPGIRTRQLTEHVISDMLIWQYLVFISDICIWHLHVKFMPGV